MAEWRIMAVDDDRDILQLVKHALIPHYEVVTFHEPMAAFQLIDTVQPDMLILDVMMPRLTGYQIAEMIHHQSKWAEVPIVFLSAKDGNRDIKYGYKLGAAVYLTKPFQPDRLRRNIDSIFENNPPTPKRKKHSAEELVRLLKVKSQFGIASELGAGGKESSAAKSDSTNEDEESEGPAQSPDPAWLD